MTSHRVPAARTASDAMRMLEVLATLRRATLSEIAAAVGVTTSKAHRLLSTLEGRGYVERRVGKAYELGPVLLHLGHRAARGHPLLRAAHAVLDGLSGASGQAALLAIRVGTERLIVDSRDSRYGPQVAWPRDSRLPLNSGALGICLLAHAPPEALETMIDQGLTAFTEATASSARALGEAVAEVRRSGVYVSKHTFVHGVYSIAAPVLVGDRSAIAAVAIVGDADRLDRATEAAFSDQVRLAAAAIARNLA